MEKVPVVVGNVVLGRIFDSGASCNVVDRATWEDLKEKRVQSVSRKCTEQIYSYDCENPLETVRYIVAILSCNSRSVNIEIIVIEGKGQSLLCRETVKELGVLKIGMNKKSVNSVGVMQESLTMSEYEKLYTNVFKGVGKLNKRAMMALYRSTG